MTADRLRTAAAKLREQGGARNIAVAKLLDDAAMDAHYRAKQVTKWIGETVTADEVYVSHHALAVADAVLAEVAV